MEVAFSYLGCYGNMQQRRCLAEHQELQWSGLRFEISGRCQTGETSSIGLFIFLEKASLKGGRYKNNVWKTGANRHILKKSSISRKQVGRVVFFLSCYWDSFFGAGSHVNKSQLGRWSFFLEIFHRIRGDRETVLKKTPSSGNGCCVCIHVFEVCPLWRKQYGCWSTWQGAQKKNRWCLGERKPPKNRRFSLSVP